jgi:leader peptidase (prepilin peptidase)/N-methyltransferase
MTPFIVGTSALFGLIIGSFLNVVAYRIPAGMSVVQPPSACPHCDHPIRPRDNVPVVSWLMLAGRCRDCGEPISPRYPIVEATTGLLFGGTAWIIGDSWTLPAYLVFIAVTVAVTLTDLDHKLIPNRILFPGTGIGVVLLGGGAVLDSALGDFGRALLGAAAYFLVLLVIALIAGGGFGFGDVKLGFFLGLFLGYQSWGILLVGGFLSFFLGGVISILLLLFRIKGRKDAIPFGPYMVVGAYLGLVFGSAIVDWYTRAGV